MAVCGKPGKRYGCFPLFPQTLEIAGRLIPESKLIPSDFHIPSATVAAVRMTEIQKRKAPSNFAYPSLPSGSSFDWKRL
jgi:hypothetical protein